MSKSPIRIFLGFLIAIIIPVGFYLYFHYLGIPKRPQLKKFYPISEEFTTDYSVKVNDTLFHAIPPFSLDGHTGKKITEETFKDKIYVADFFFSRCPGICPVITNAMKKVSDEFRNDDSIMFLSHTVDPEYDTPKVLERYANRFEADSTKWHFVTGSMDSLTYLSKKAYFLALNPGTESTEAIDHSGRLVLVDKNRIIRGYFMGTDTAAVDKLIASIYVLKLEYKEDRTRDLEYDPNK